MSTLAQAALAQKKREVAAEAETLQAQMVGHRKKVEELRALETQVTFESLHGRLDKIPWALELTDDLHAVKLSAWVDRADEQDLVTQLVKDLGLVKDASQVVPGCVGIVALWEGGNDLFLICNVVENLPPFIREYKVQLHDRAHLIEKIDRKVKALSELQDLARRLFVVT